MNVNEIRKRRADELKAFRLEKGMSKALLQRSSGLSKMTINRIESGTIGWNIDSEMIYFETVKNHVNASM